MYAEYVKPFVFDPTDEGKLARDTRRTEKEKDYAWDINEHVLSNEWSVADGVKVAPTPYWLVDRAPQPVKAKQPIEAEELVKADQPVDVASPTETKDEDVRSPARKKSRSKTGTTKPAVERRTLPVRLGKGQRKATFGDELSEVFTSTVSILY